MNAHLPYDAPEVPTDALPDLSGVTDVTLDTETTGLDWVRGARPVGIALAYGPERRYVPFAHRGGGNLDEGVVKRWAKAELRGKRITGFNTRFDLHQLRVWGVDLRDQDNTFHDVSHDGCLLDDHRSKARLKLDDFAEDYLGETKTNIGRPEHIADLPGNTVAPYARRDVDLTQRLAAAMAPELARQDLLRVQALEDACIPVTVEIESHGLPLDLETLARWADELPRIAHRLITELHAACGFACTPSKKPDMARLFQKAGLTYGHTPTGQAKFDADDLDAAAKQSPVIQLAQRWLKVQHLLSKVIVPFGREQVNGVLYPSYHQMLGEGGGTISGRYSSSRPNGQNLLNKRKYQTAYGWLAAYSDQQFMARSLVVPERGGWVNADMAQIEYRVAAHYTGSARIRQWYVDDPKTDQHAKVADLIRPFRRDITRESAKAPGFARLYGGGVGTVARNLGIEDNEAEALIAQYDRAFPEFGVLADKAKSVANQRGYVRSLLGRRSRFLGTPGRREFIHKALNCICQSTAADIAKQADVAVYAERRRLGMTMRNVEHDALGGDLEGPVAPLQALLDEQRAPLSIPALWDVKTGNNWAETK